VKERTRNLLTIAVLVLAVAAVWFLVVYGLLCLLA
jgi:hypothetical protein